MSGTSPSNENQSLNTVALRHQNPFFCPIPLGSTLQGQNLLRTYNQVEIQDKFQRKEALLTIQIFELSCQTNHWPFQFQVLIYHFDIAMVFQRFINKVFYLLLDSNNHLSSWFSDPLLRLGSLSKLSRDTDSALYFLSSSWIIQTECRPISYSPS